MPVSSHSPDHNPFGMTDSMLDLMDRLETALADGTPAPTLSEAMQAASEQIESA